MSTQETKNKELVCRYVQEVTVEGKLDRIEAYIIEDWVAHSTSMPDTHGPAEYREFVTMLRTAFPDLNVTFEDLVAEGNKVVVRSRYTGTHEGEFMGIEPTGNEGDMGAIVTYQIEDGKIVKEWHQADMLGLMQQLGVAPSPEEAVP